MLNASCSALWDFLLCSPPLSCGWPMDPFKLLPHLFQWITVVPILASEQQFTRAPDLCLDHQFSPTISLPESCASFSFTGAGQCAQRLVHRFDAPLNFDLGNSLSTKEKYAFGYKAILQSALQVHKVEFRLDSLHMVFNACYWTLSWTTHTSLL